MFNRFLFVLIYFFFLALFVTKSEAFLFKVDDRNLPSFQEKDIDSLIAAWQRELPFLYDAIEKGDSLNWGKSTISPKRILRTGELLIKTIRQAKNEKVLNQLIRERFEVYSSVGDDGRGSVLFTGYYTPLFKGSLIPLPQYPWPVYRRPPDLYSVDLGLFYPELKGKEIAFRIVNGKVKPYYTRREIVKEKVLANKGLEILWLKDRIERYFLMIQGSGKILLPEGKTIRLKYDCKNGRPYTSIGRLLIEKEGLDPRETSLEGIKRYFGQHPEKIDQYLFANESWVFFKVESDGPHGWTNAILTPRRSIATDKSIFPGGGVAYIIYDEPVVDSQGKLVALRKCARFVFDQDKGSAITGPGRVDIYIGEGDRAGQVAGKIYSRGRLYYLLAK